MAYFLEQVDYYWSIADRLQVILFGIFLGVITGIIPDLAFGEPVFLGGMGLYFPFHIWLTYQLFKTFFSANYTKKLLGKMYSPVPAIFLYVFTTKYGLFCVSWFYATMIYVSIAHWEFL